jgi:hypothetical protein
MKDHIYNHHLVLVPATIIQFYYTVSPCLIIVLQRMCPISDRQEIAFHLLPNLLLYFWVGIFPLPLLC